MREVRVFDDGPGLAGAALDRLVELAQVAVAARGRFTLALSGGSTPRALYSRLARRADLRWSAIHLFWGDERCVPPDSLNSNYRMAADTLVERVPLASENVHRIRGELGRQDGAADYALELERFFGGPPLLDLVHLGVGPDGHVASIFPMTPASPGRTVIGTIPTPGLKPAVDRVSLTPDVIDAAHEVHVLAAGASKAAIVSRVLGGDSTIPAGRLAGRRVVWFLDREAAGGWQGEAATGA